jgi:GTPase
MRRFLQALRPLQHLPLNPAPGIPTPLRILSTSSAAASSESDSAPAAAPTPAADADFDSSDYALPTPGPAPSRKINNPVAALRKLRFDPSLRARADEALFGKGLGAAAVEEQDEEHSRDVALALLDAALEPPDEDEDDLGEVKEEDQMSLSVGIVGAPNAGKSSLTNTMVRMASKTFFCFTQSHL